MGFALNDIEVEHHTIALGQMAYHVGHHSCGNITYVGWRVIHLFVGNVFAIIHKECGIAFLFTKKAESMVDDYACCPCSQRAFSMVLKCVYIRYYA